MRTSKNSSQEAQMNVNNILFSTTRQWNPGDEFILFGIRRLFAAIGLQHNPVIFNRNPEVNPPLTDWNPLRRIARTLKGEQYWKSFVRIGSADNSYKPGMDARFLDLAVFAGTPSWSSRENLPMYRAIREAALPACYLGIGGFPTLADPSFVFPPAIDRTLREALLITTRDRKAYELLKGYGAHYLPCPALLSSPMEKRIDQVATIGLIYSAWRTHKSHSVPKASHEKLVELYKTIRTAYGDKVRIVFIAHYIDELPEIREHFGKDAQACYSYDAREYIDIYRECDLVVGARVHGIGMAASLGIPGLHLGHDGRAGTVEGFMADNIHTDQWADVARIKAVIDEAIASAPQKNEVLRQHKHETFTRYCSLLQTRLKGMLDRPPRGDATAPAQPVFPVFQMG
jgi:polysaccharide pyruvyl transferase WcaK-like protein